MSFNSLICRLCLLESNSNVSMFTSSRYDEARNDYLSHKVMQIASVQIYEGDGLPTLICRPCLCRVEGFFQFKNQIEKSDFFLRQQVYAYQNKNINQVHHKHSPKTRSLLRLCLEKKQSMLSMKEKGGEPISSTCLDKHSEHVKSEPLPVLKNGVYLPDSLWTDNVQTYSAISHCETLTEPVTVSTPHPQEVVENPQPTFVNLGCEDNEETKSLLDLTQQDDKCVKQSLEPLTSFQNGNSCDSAVAEVHEEIVDKPTENYYVDKFLNQSECIHDETSKSLVKETAPQLDKSNETNIEENPTDYSVSLNLVAVVASENEESDHDEDEVDDCNDNKSEKNEASVKKTKTKPIKIMYCEECDIHFDKPVNLRKHQSSHVKESFKCSYCNKCFRHSWSLQSHIGTHTGERPFTCNICTKSFTDRSALSSHQRITHFTEKTHMCSYCGKAFKLKKQLERHERIHTGHEYHRCDICGKLFTQKCNLMKHLVLHSGQKPFSCSICQQSFAQKDNLNIHVLRHHSQQNPVVCDVCGKLFKNKMTLVGHKKTKHTENIKQIICEVCGKFFPDRSCLNSHKWVHSGGPIECDICGKSYPHARAIRVHKRIVHTEVRKYCCDVCGIGFKTSQTLKHHKVVHTGERAFGCEECGRCFGQRTALKTHMRIHSGIEPYSCPRCNESFKWKQTCDKHVIKCVGKPHRDFVITAEDSIS